MKTPPAPPAADAKMNERKVTRLTKLTQLAVITRAPLVLKIKLESDEDVEVPLRALTGDETAEIDALPAPIPPRKTKTDHRNQIVDDGVDTDDPNYRKERQKYFQLRDTMVLSLGLVGVEIEGETLDAKSVWLRKNLPPRFIAVLVDKILALSVNTIEQASFV